MYSLELFEIISVLIWVLTMIYQLNIMYISSVVQAQPFFLPPTLTSESTVLCEVNKTCHINMHFTEGDNFGYPGKW